MPDAQSSYTYDLNGNLSSRNDGTNAWTYEWDVEHELTRVTKELRGRIAACVFGAKALKLTATFGVACFPGDAA